MANKLVVGLLVFLVVLSCGTGAYSYILSQEVNNLNEQLVAFHEEQAGRISTLQENQDEQKSRLTAVGDEVTGLREETQSKLDTLGQKIDGTLADVNVLEEEVAGITDQLSQYLADASELYQKAVIATVRIGDGDRLAGTGFLYTESHVITANHVVENLNQVYVTFPDGRVSAATVTGTSQYSDVAVLALDKRPDIEPLVLADSDMIKVGETVFAIGNPFGLQETLTSGIVSGTSRYVPVEFDLQQRAVANLIQFDAAANYGNSGCPLLNTKGEVIGLVIARVKPDEGDGIGYAVSSNKVRRVAESLINQGHFDYPWLGVEVSDLTPKIVQEKGLDTAHGAWVRNVLAAGPAETAGVKADDIIIAMDGVAIKSVADLTSYLGEHTSPGGLSTVTVLRDKTELELSVRIGQAP